MGVCDPSALAGTCCINLKWISGHTKASDKPKVPATARTTLSSIGKTNRGSKCSTKVPFESELTVNCNKEAGTSIAKCCAVN